MVERVGDTLVRGPSDHRYLLDIASLGWSLHRCMRLENTQNKSCQSPNLINLAA